jgi:tetratricopeptide (TPR) repeat protein
MRKLLFAFLLLACVNVNAQTKPDTLTGQAAKELLNKVLPKEEVFLKSSADNACKCIDEIKAKKKSKEKIAGEIKKCVDKEVTSYQLMLKMMLSMKASKEDGKDQVITISDDKNSTEYQKYYFEIERELRDSCQSLITLMSSNEITTKKSISKNDDAIYFYTEGQNFMKREEYETAIEKYKEAVKIDPYFAFAWDNLGISYRKINKFKEAIEAYKKSLEIDPKGITPLQNLAVAYQYTKEYDKAVEVYKSLIALKPEDPEGYYGVGQVLLTMKEHEKSLDYVCKAYNLYVKMGSPYRSDAEQLVQILYGEFKKTDKVDSFNKILKDNKISPLKN